MKFAKRKNMTLLFLLFMSMILMGIGYASIQSVTGEITGKASSKMQDGVFITNVEYVSDVDANKDSSKIELYSGTMMKSTVKLSSTNINSQIKYKVTVYNNSEETIKDWYVNLYATNIEITQIWNGKSTIENGILKITPEEYNMEIQSKQKIEVGFIANSSSKEDLNNMKCIDETSNEIQNDNKEENMKNTVQEESKEQKEERVEAQ